MEVKAWKNGKHNKSGAGYGLKIPADELSCFQREWNTVSLFLDGDEEKSVEVNISDSFWALPGFACDLFIGMIHFPA